MPRPAAAIGADGLPLWDTFEAIFFLVAGLSVGLVLGFLFPSLWRSFRRRFRDTKRFAPLDLDTLPDAFPEGAPSPGAQMPQLAVLAADDASDDTPELALKDQRLIPEAFVLARGAVQEGRPRDAVKIYLDILAMEQVSKQQTNRALFELSQVYGDLGLHNRALETGLELLHRKPENNRVFSYLLDLCIRNSDTKRMNMVLAAFKGHSDDATRMRISHAVCALAEKDLRNGKSRDALARTRQAVGWHVLSARAKLLLWRITSEELWEKSGQDTRALWSLLGADLEARMQIFRDTGVSAAAASDHLGKLLAYVSAAHDPRGAFLSMQHEFLKVSGLERMSEAQHRVFESLILHAFLSLSQDPRFMKDDALFEVLSCLAEGPFLNYLRSFRSNSDTPSLAFLATRAGLSLHRCGACRSHAVAYAWACGHCASAESLQPVLSLEHAAKIEEPDLPLTLELPLKNTV